jgi:prophage antirepressor-like protein
MHAGHVAVDSITKDGNPFFVAAKSAASIGEAAKSNTNPIMDIKKNLTTTPSLSYNHSFKSFYLKLM